jgi:hypothetical protein
LLGLVIHRDLLYGWAFDELMEDKGAIHATRSPQIASTTKPARMRPSERPAPVLACRYTPWADNIAIRKLNSDLANHLDKLTTPTVNGGVKVYQRGGAKVYQLAQENGPQD